MDPRLASPCSPLPPCWRVFASHLLLAGLGVLSAGCYASGIKVDQQTLVELHPGHTTCAEIREKYGVPTSAALSSDGTQQLVYTYVQSQARPASFIPIAGAFLRGGDTEQTQVVFDCDRRGILVHYASTQGKIGAGTGFISGGKQ